MANDLSKGNTVEDLIEHAQSKGLSLPKNHMESIRTSLEQNKSNPEQIRQHIDKIATKHSEKGYGWHMREDHDPRYPLLRYMDKSGKTCAYIAERTNKQTGEKFYAANRINGKNEHIKLATNNNLDTVKHHVNSYYTGVSIREISNARNVQKQQEKSVSGPAADKPGPRKEKSVELSL
jgi:hypothetical protein